MRTAYLVMETGHVSTASVSVPKEIAHMCLCIKRKSKFVNFRGVILNIRAAYVVLALDARAKFLGILLANTI